MIDKNLAEPPIEHRYCVYCGKRKRLTATLLHWPFEGFKGEMVTLPNGNKVEPFSYWSYECAWCKAICTKRRKRWGY